MKCTEDIVKANTESIGYLASFLDEYIDVLAGARAARLNEVEQMRDELYGIALHLKGEINDS